MFVSRLLTQSFNFKPIGYAKTIFKQKAGTPRQPTLTNAPTVIDTTSYNTESTNLGPALEKLTDFSHCWIIFVFHKNDLSTHQITLPHNQSRKTAKPSLKTKVSPPRLNGEKVGIFASRTPHRPNPIGMSLCKIDKVRNGKLFLKNSDLLDGTPILDIKPYITAYDKPEKNIDIIEPEYVKTGNFKELTVEFDEQVLEKVSKLKFELFETKDEFMEVLSDVLQHDPRSVYRKTHTPEKLFSFAP